MADGKLVSPRFETVDLLRGVAILLVVVFHTGLRFFLSGYSPRHLLPRLLTNFLFFNGGNGVTVFFAVSGFLITLTSIDRFGSLAAMRPGHFYRIRFARIGPLLLLLLAVLSVLALCHAPGFRFSVKMAPLWEAVLAALTFWLNWLEAQTGYLPANWDVLWSLSVEEMFYLAFPLVCLALLRLRRGMAGFIALLLVFVAMGPFARSVWTANEIWEQKTYLGGMDAIALGCLSALLVDALRRRTRSGWSALHRRVLRAVEGAGALILLIIAVGPRWFYRLFPATPDLYGSVLPLAVCAVIVPSVLLRRHDQPSRLNRLTGPIRWFGRHSYEVYLTHEFVVVWVTFLFVGIYPNANGDKPAPHPLTVEQIALWFSATLMLSAALGYVTAKYISEPLNRRLRPPSTPAAELTVPAAPAT